MKKILSCLLTVFAALALACSGGSGDDGVSPTGGSPSGGGAANLRVHLTDAPIAGVQAVNVTITAIRVHQSASAGEGVAGWSELPVTASMPVDLLSLQGGVLYELCAAQLAAGHYQQVRIVLAPNEGAAPPYRNSIVLADGSEVPLDVPREIKVVHSFTVAEGTTTDLTLDFVADKSLRQRGKGDYFVVPVIHPSSKTI